MEKNRTKNILISCFVIVILTCVCVGLIVVSGVGVTLIWPIDFRRSESIPSSNLGELVEPMVPPLQQGNSLDETDQALELPEDIARMINTIETQVSQIRGLSLSDPIPRILISPEELREIVVNEFFADYSEEDARRDVLILSLIGLLPQDFDLRNFYLDLYGEQIAGFYDSELGEIYVVQGAGFGGGEKLTYAHEFTHALQDQTFRFDEGLDYNEKSCQENSERCAAIKSLIEGDATLTEVIWFQTYATRADYRDIIEAFENYSSPVLDNAPPYMRKNLLFPYEQGFAFVEYLFNNGGFEAIDAAYQNVPVSTEQILHPERYPWDQPQPVVLPNLENLLGEDWILFDQNVMGEWFTYLILSQSHNEAYRLAEDEAASAAAGWGGDAYAFYLNETTDDVIFILDMVWDTSEDADEFYSSLVRYANLRWAEGDLQISGFSTWQGIEGTIVITQEDDRTLWIIAPNASFVEMILLEYQ